MSSPFSFGTGGAILSKADRRPNLVLVTIAAGLALAVLIGLGGWQLVRLEEKSAQIDMARQRLAEPAGPWPAEISDPAQLDYMRVETVFTPRQGRLMFQPGGSPTGRAGLRVLVASDVEGASVPVLVDLGWIPLDMQQGSILLPEGPLQVSGVLRAPEEPTLLTPGNDPEQRLWYWLELPAMARMAEVDALAPVVIRAERIRTSDGVPTLVDFPLQGPTLLNIPNDHLRYAITWFALAVVLVVILLVFLRRQRRERKPAQP